MSIRKIAFGVGLLLISWAGVVQADHLAGTVTNAPPLFVDTRCDNHECDFVNIDNAVDAVTGAPLGNNLLDTAPAPGPATLPLYWGDSPLTGGYVAGAGIAIGGGSIAINTAGISACTGAGQKLLWDAANARLGCGSDQGGSYFAGSGLSLAGTTFSVNPTQVQLRVTGSCVAGSYVRAIAQDGTVTCQNDANSGGTVTQVATGTGLAGGPITSTGTVSLNTVGVSACTGTAQKVLWDSTNGRLGCGTDQDTTYSAGSGLSLTGTAFSANPAVVQLRVGGSCAAGSSIRAIAQDGTVTCQTDSNSGGTVTSVGSGAGLTGGPITSSGSLSLNTVGISTCAGATQKVLWDSTNGRLGCGTDANSGGTVTSIATSGGLTGGPITGSGTVSIADGGVTTAKLADGSVTSAKLAAGVTTPGWSILSDDGTWKQIRITDGSFAVYFSGTTASKTITLPTGTWVLTGGVLHRDASQGVLIAQINSQTVATTTGCGTISGACSQAVYSSPYPADATAFPVYAPYSGSITVGFNTATLTGKLSLLFTRIA